MDQMKCDYEALKSEHELSAQRAVRIALDRRHEIDEDPARFQPHYICPQGG